MSHHIVIVSNTSWSISNFRTGLIKALQQKGCRITAVSPPDKYENKILELGCNYTPLKNLQQAGTNPFTEWKLYREFVHLFESLQPDVILLYTPKPNIYGGLAAASLNIPYINTVNGLGYTFQNPGLLSKLVLRLYKAGFKKSRHVFFQNKDDLNYFLERDIIDVSKTSLVPGSGVDTILMQPVGKSSGNNFVFLLCTRLVAEKGVMEYINAAKQLHKEFPSAIFRLIGKPAIHPNAIAPLVINQYKTEGIIDYIEEVDDINEALNDADVLVHPSYYREGIPRILLEGLSKGLPLITTNSVGCKETVDNNINGLLVAPQNVNELASAMHFMISADTSVLSAMGEASRKKAVTQFSETIVIDKYLERLFPPGDISSTSAVAKPRLLLIINRLIIGGQTFDTLPLAYHLKNMFEILIVYGDKEKDEMEALYFLDNYPGLQLKKVKNIKRAINPFYDVPAFFSLKKIIREFKPDIVHTHGAKSGLLGRLAAKLSGVQATVHTYHGHVFHSYFTKTVTSLVIKTERWLAKYTTLIIALSETQKNELMHWLKVPAKKINVVPLGIDYIDSSKACTYRKEFRRKYRLPDNTVAIGITGRLTYIKNLPLFVDVVRQVLQTKPHLNVKFFVIGDGTEKSNIIARLNNYHIQFSEGDNNTEAQLIFTSWITNIQEAIEGLDIVVLTSFNEGTPMSLIEAQLCGKPVIAVNVGGVTDTFISNKTGFLIPEHDAEMFADKIEQLVTDNNLRKQMGEEAGKFASAKFSKQNEKLATVAYYEKLLHNSELIS